MDVEGERETGLEKTGTLWTATAHIVSVMIGSSVLAFAWTFAQLGWVASPAILLAFCGVIYYTSALLADCYRYPDPVTGAPNHEFVDAVRCYLGPRKAFWCALVQYTTIWATLIGYTITTTTSISAMYRVQCFHGEGSGGGDGDGGACKPSGSAGVYMMLAFCAIQVPLSQLPNLEKIAWLSYSAVATSFGYSLILLGLCFAKWGLHGGDVRGTAAGAAAASPVDKLSNVFLAVGNIGLSYIYTDVLIEIQDTLKSPPAENKTMKKASLYGLVVSTVFYLLLGIAGYAAFGNGAPGNLLSGAAFHEPFWLVDAANACVVVHFVAAYQVFAQAMFARLEKCVSDRWPGAWFVRSNYHVRLPAATTLTLSLSPMNLVLRTAVVTVTTLVAMLIPFFNAVLGLIGAMGFWPLSVYFPVAMHIARLKIQRGEARWWMLQAMSLCCLLISVGMGAASVKDIVDNLTGAAPFNTVY
ncbi:hypothetical protein ACP70R_015274 [Stipagrostis hirtigluma subsp. patula]